MRKPDLTKIKMFLADVDGTLTDGGMIYHESGDIEKKFHAHDGMAAVLLYAAGIMTGVITGAESKAVLHRAKTLGFCEIWQAIDDKLPIVNEIASRRGLSLSEIAYIGDDINDLEVMLAVGFSAAPSDARPEILAIADYICKAPGGRGAFREAADLVLKAAQAAAFD